MKNILKLTAILFSITAIVAALLAGANMLTKERIATAEEQKLQQAISEVLPGGENAQKIDYFTEGDTDVKVIYQNENGYAVQVETAGFGGTITMMVGISPMGNVLGISIVSHSETPGLGAVAAADNAAGQEFREQFKGLYGTVTVTKDGGQVDALTGATITSRAVAEGVSAAHEAVRGYLIQEVNP